MILRKASFTRSSPSLLDKYWSSSQSYLVQCPLTLCFPFLGLIHLGHHFAHDSPEGVLHPLLSITLGQVLVLKPIIPGAMSAYPLFPVPRPDSSRPSLRP